MKEFFAPSHVKPAAPYWPVPGVNGGGIASVQESEHGDDGGDHCETTLEAKSTANHCGGTALLSDWRAWAVELGLDEIDRLIVLVPVVRVSTRPCQLWRGVVRSPGWNRRQMDLRHHGPKTKVTRCRGVQAQHACSEE